MQPVFFVCYNQKTESHVWNQSLQPTAVQEHHNNDYVDSLLFTTYFRHLKHPALWLKCELATGVSQPSPHGHLPPIILPGNQCFRHKSIPNSCWILLWDILLAFFPLIESDWLRRWSKVQGNWLETGKYKRSVDIKKNCRWKKRAKGDNQWGNWKLYCPRREGVQHKQSAIRGAVTLSCFCVGVGVCGHRHQCASGKCMATRTLFYRKEEGRIERGRRQQKWKVTNVFLKSMGSNFAPFSADWENSGRKDNKWSRASTHSFDAWGPLHFKCFQTQVWFQI